MPENLLSKRLLTLLRVQGLLLLLVLGALATPALAHRVLVFAYAEGDTIFTESKFIPNDPVRQGKILVINAKTGQELLTGTTDDQGTFSFKIPAEAAAQKMDLKIVVEAAMGHRGEWLLKAASYLPGVETAVAPAPARGPVTCNPGRQGRQCRSASPGSRLEQGPGAPARPHQRKAHRSDHAPHVASRHPRRPRLYPGLLRFVGIFSEQKAGRFLSAIAEPFSEGVSLAHLSGPPGENRSGRRSSPS